jgi:hypothetical protein
MTIVVGQMTDTAVLTTFCKFIDSTQTDVEKTTKSTMFDNEVGVSHVHAQRCTDLLTRIGKGDRVWGSDIVYARKILVIYRRQIVEMGLI